MIKRIILVICLCGLTMASIAATTVIPYEDIDSNKISDEKLNELSQISKDHVLKSSEAQISSSELELLDVELVIEENKKSESGETILQSSGQNNESPLCFPRKDNSLTNLMSDVQKVFPIDPPKNKHMIYFTWGYNRNFHSKSDATFTTNSGTFTS